MVTIFYAESNFRFIFPESKGAVRVSLPVLLQFCTEAVNSFDLAWNLADIFMGFMAIVNPSQSLLLGKWALLALDDYSEQKSKGLDPVFLASSIPGLPKTVAGMKEHLEDFGSGPMKRILEESVDMDFAWV